MAQINQATVESNTTHLVEYIKTHGLEFETLVREKYMRAGCKKLVVCFTAHIDPQLSSYIVNVVQCGAAATLEFVDDTYTSIRYSITGCSGETVSVVLKAAAYHELKDHDTSKLDDLGKKCYDALREKVNENQALRIALYMKDLEIAKLRQS